MVTSADVLLTINYTPLPVATPSGQSICSGNSVSILMSDNNAVSSGTTYSFSTVFPSGISGTGNAGPTGSGDVSGTLSNSNPNSAATVTYTINATTPDNCPAIPITASVTVNPNVLVSSQPVSATRCSNTSSATFTVANGIANAYIPVAGTGWWSRSV